MIIDLILYHSGLIEGVDNLFGQDSCLFIIIVDVTELGLLLILYNLGTTKMKVRERSEASTGASTRFTVNDD
jgi:hypothetical protein